ncbi:MAG TPA: FMN-binding negative transcriptional regulator [Chitinophagaceae bacterium]|nr:FMN-binding negative transcriptional regulator [Chitinophagaceae bacterium]
MTANKFIYSDRLDYRLARPFIVTEGDERIILPSHFAKANKQWTEITGNQVLIIFSEPHAYISPKHYDKELKVPTWNYISIHA